MKYGMKETLKEIGTWVLTWFFIVTAIGGGIVLAEYLKFLIMILFIL